MYYFPSFFDEVIVALIDAEINTPPEAGFGAPIDAAWVMKKQGFTVVTRVSPNSHATGAGW